MAKGPCWQCQSEPDRLEISKHFFAELIGVIETKKLEGIIKKLYSDSIRCDECNGDKSNKLFEIIRIIVWSRGDVDVLDKAEKEDELE